MLGWLWRSLFSRNGIAPIRKPTFNESCRDVEESAVDLRNAALREKTRRAIKEQRG